jgi:hypothetical protein
MTENQSARPSPALVQRHLHGLDYPASRDDLVNYARRECKGGSYPQGECERVLQVLSQLPDREYQRPVDVSKALVFACPPRPHPPSGAPGQQHSGPAARAGSAAG